MALVLSDTREGNGALPFLPGAVAENNRKAQRLSLKEGGGEIGFRKQQLTVGDYSILLPSRLGTGWQLVCVLERKTWKDLAVSIKDGRASSQQEALSKLQRKGCRVYFLIEGSLSFADTREIAGVSFKQLHAKLRHNLLRGFPFLQCKTPEEGARVIVNLARDFLKLQARGEFELPDTLPALLQGFRSELALLGERYQEKLRKLPWPEGSPSLQAHLAAITNTVETGSLTLLLEEEHPLPPSLGGEGGGEEVPEELRTRRVQSETDVLQTLWRSLPGVSEKTAPVLMTRYTLREILLAGEEKREELRKEISELRYPGGRVFGEKLARSVLQLSGTLRDLTLELRVLSSIPGISRTTAGFLLEGVSLRELCTLDIAGISQLKLRNRRVLGEALAERIFTLFNLKG